MRGIIGLFVSGFIGINLLSSGIGFIAIPIYLYCLLVGRKKRIERAHNRISTLLMNKEQLINTALELRLNTLLLRRRLLAITDSRVIILHRKIFGGYKMKDYQWKDLHDVVLTENAFPNYFGSTLEFNFIGATTSLISISGIPSDIATSIYSFAQRQEQSWEEKRRIREIEENRSKAGGVHISGLAGAANFGGGQSGGKSAVEQITEAKALLDAGMISDAEYHEIKSKILGQSFI